MLMLNSMGFQEILRFIFPNMYALHQLPGNVDENGMPPCLPCSSEHLTQGGVILLDDAHTLYVWISQSVAPVLPELDNPVSEAVRRVFKNIRSNTGAWQQLSIVRDN